MAGALFEPPAPDPNGTCLGCSNWNPAGTREWAALMGMAVCLEKRTQAHTLAHWRRCGAFFATRPDEVQRRVLWLRQGGLYRKVLSGGVQSPPARS